MTINLDLEVAAWDVVRAAGRMLDNWAESSAQVRNADLWQPLHQATDRLRAELETPDATTEAADTLIAAYIAAAAEDGAAYAEATFKELEDAFAAATLVAAHVQRELETRGDGRG